MVVLRRAGGNARGCFVLSGRVRSMTLWQSQECTLSIAFCWIIRYFNFSFLAGTSQSYCHGFFPTVPVLTTAPITGTLLTRNPPSGPQRQVLRVTTSLTQFFNPVSLASAARDSPAAYWPVLWRFCYRKAGEKQKIQCSHCCPTCANSTPAQALLRR